MIMCERCVTGGTDVGEDRRVGFAVHGREIGNPVRRRGRTDDESRHSHVTVHSVSGGGDRRFGLHSRRQPRRSHSPVRSGWISGNWISGVLRRWIRSCLSAGRRGMRDDIDHSPNARTSLIGFDPLAALSDSLLFFDDCRVQQHSCVRYIQAPSMFIVAIL